MSTGLPGVGIFGTSPAALLLVPALKVLQECLYVGIWVKKWGRKEPNIKASQFVEREKWGMLLKK